MKMPRIASSRSGLVFSTMCTSPRRDPEGGSRPRAARPRRRGGSGRDRARSSRSRRRGGSATAPCPAARSRRTSSRGGVPLCGPKRTGRAAPGRLSRLDRVHLDDALACALGACRSVSAPSVTRTSEIPVGARRELGGLALEQQRRRCPRLSRPVERAAPAKAKEDSGRSPTSRGSPPPRCSVSCASSEPRWGGAARPQRRPSAAEVGLSKPSCSSSSDAFPSSTTRPVERT